MSGGLGMSCTLTRRLGGSWTRAEQKEKTEDGVLCGSRAGRDWVYQGITGSLRSWTGGNGCIVGAEGKSGVRRVLSQQAGKLTPGRAPIVMHEPQYVMRRIR